MSRTVGYFLQQPSVRRRRLEATALSHLSLLWHTALFCFQTPGARFDVAATAAGLRAIADELDSIGPLLVAELDLCSHVPEGGQEA